jgi:hypothetical protein
MGGPKGFGIAHVAGKYNFGFSSCACNELEIHTTHINNIQTLQILLVSLVFSICAFIAECYHFILLRRYLQLQNTKEAYTQYSKGFTAKAFSVSLFPFVAE